MILILSESECETSTEEVIDWLEYFCAPVFRLNGEDLDGGASFNFEISGRVTRNGLSIDGAELPFDEVEVIWYRRWLRDRRHDKADLVEVRSSAAGKLNQDIRRHLTLESRRLSEFVFSRFSNVPWLSKPSTSNLDKLRVLEIAAEEGLATPVTIVTSERREVKKFLEDHGSIVTKPIGEVQILFCEDYSYFMYTSPLDQSAVDSLPERFAPSLFQERVEKRFEIRTFYLDGQCSAMAIFSQLDRQTQEDFRRYNYRRPNRCVPYRLSPQTIDCIKRLMFRLEIETGSLDFIKAQDGRDVFLEINPVGQFGMVSKPCNYPLEMQVAAALMRRLKHEQ